MSLRSVGLIISESKIIFVHIPKCAGKSVKRSLLNAGHNGGHHAYPSDIIKKYPQEWEDFFRFTIVRNPWSRLVSGFFFFKNIAMARWKDRKSQNKHQRLFRDIFKWNFGTFVRKFEQYQKSIYKINFFVPQSKWLFDESGEPYKYDYIGRTEKLKKDIDFLARELDIKNNTPIDHLNSTEHGPYFQYYNKETEKIVANIYEKDIKYLGYKFR